MVDEFRAAFQELIDASVATDPHQFPPAVHKVYLLASHIPTAERELALEALTPLLAGDHAAPGVIADLAVVAGALVEMGTDPGPTGPEILHLLRTMGTGAIAFLRAWERTGTDTPPDPDTVTADAEARVADQLGHDAPAATMCWWTIRRHGLATKSMLSQPEVRSHIRRDPSLHAQLVAITNQLSHHLTEFDEVRTLLRMAEATSALVMDRTSKRAFRVLFDGIGDNYQLHTLLADALIGPQGQGLPGQAPDPRWVAAYRSAPPDPQAPTVRGWWNLVAHDGSWVWNEGLPAEIPTIDGEHVLILDEQPYPRSWKAHRRHPQVHGWLEVDSELDAEEALLWWKRVAPAQTPTFTEDPAEPPLPQPVLLDTEPETDQAPRVHGFVPKDERTPPGFEQPDPAQESERPPTPQAHEEPTEPEGSQDHAEEEQPGTQGQETAQNLQEPEHPAPHTPDPTQRRSPGPALPPLPRGVSQSKGWGPTWR